MWSSITTMPWRTKPEESFPQCRLPYTLQTYVGMVYNQGKPASRHAAEIPAYLSEKPTKIMNRSDYLSSSSNPEAFRTAFKECVVQRCLPQLSDKYRVGELDIMRVNVFACCNDQIDVDVMKRYIHSRKRLDHEQAAAVVISAVGNDKHIENRPAILRALIDGLDIELLRKSCMWLTISDEADELSATDAKFSHLAEWVTGKIREKYGIEIPKIEDWASMVEVLQRIRRRHPTERCVWIPNWIFEKAGVDKPDGYPVWREDGQMGQGVFPSAQAEPNSIMLSRKHFRALQRRIIGFYRFWKPVEALRRSVNELQDEVLFCSERITPILENSSDTLLIAHYFFSFQRRQQLKVVSDIQWTRFLAKGEGKTILQNNPNILTLFEEDLGNFAGLSGVPIMSDVTKSIDRCCSLMEEYVRVYGDGDPTKLVFQKGIGGGSGRGCVDLYNLLCDVLQQLRNAAKAQNLDAPGPVRKFLAKDIMSWNRSFADDAFANGAVPGWEPWLKRRRDAGLLAMPK